MKKTILAILMALALVVIPVGNAFALTTADVTVTATPEFISISIVETPTWPIGAVAEGATPSTAINAYTVDNTSSVAINVSIKVVGTAANSWDGNWSGGIGWTHADDGIPGENLAGLYAGLDDADDLFDVIVKKTAVFNNIVTNQGVNTDFSFGLKLFAPTTFGDGVEKTNTVRLTASKYVA